MKVTLIDYTGCGHPDPWHAAHVLLFTKSTRLNLSPSLMKEIEAWSPQKKLDQLAYMANTIPSSWEFVGYTFMIEGVSRAFTHQFVRNRHGSYAQQSMRVVSMDQGYEFLMPQRLNDLQRAEINSVNAHILKVYGELVVAGVATEDARSILPTNIATNIVAKFNLRTMSELAKSRTGGRTQSEYISVMNAMCDAVIEVHPWAAKFLFPQSRDLYKEIEDFAEKEYAGDLLKKGELLKIVDQMRKTQ